MSYSFGSVMVDTCPAGSVLDKQGGTCVPECQFILGPNSGWSDENQDCECFPGFTNHPVTNQCVLPSEACAEGHVFDPGGRGCVPVTPPAPPPPKPVPAAVVSDGTGKALLYGALIFGGVVMLTTVFGGRR